MVQLLAVIITDLAKDFIRSLFRRRTKKTKILGPYLKRFQKYRPRHLYGKKNSWKYQVFSKFISPERLVSYEKHTYRWIDKLMGLNNFIPVDSSLEVTLYKKNRVNDLWSIDVQFYSIALLKEIRNILHYESLVPKNSSKWLKLTIFRSFFTKYAQKNTIIQLIWLYSFSINRDLCNQGGRQIE